MFLQSGKTNAILQAGNNRVTMYMTDTTSIFQVEQPDAVGGWFATTIGGDLLQLNSLNTIISFYAPMKLRVTRLSGTAEVHLVG